MITSQLHSLKNKISKKLKLNQSLVISIPYLWLILFFLIPFIIILKISFSVQEVAIPPYSSFMQYDSEINQLNLFFNFSNYSELFNHFTSSLFYELNPLNFIDKLAHSNTISNYLAQQQLITSGENIYIKTYVSSIYYALLTTFICLLIGFPMAYAISKVNPKYRTLLLLLIMLPFWTSFLLRVYAWMGLLSKNGIINHFLSKFNIAPLDIFYNEFSLILVMVYTYLPFMILPIYTQLTKINFQLIEAAGDLGAGPIKSFWQITWPLTRVGVIAGSMLVFIPAVGEFVIPELVAGAENLMIGKVLWQAFFDQNNWPLASSIAVIMVLLLLVPIIIFQHYENKRQRGHHHGK